MSTRINRRFGVVAGCLQGVGEVDALPLIREAGFDCFFTMWRGEEHLAELVKRGRELGMDCESIHALFPDVNSIWQADNANFDTLDRLTRETIAAAGKHGVPIVVLHLSSGWTPPCVCDLGLARVQAWVDCAKAHSVKLAFENLRALSHLAVLADLYRDEPSAGFCFDFGHEHCFTKTIDWMTVFEDQVLCTHIHDNFSRGEKDASKIDLHLLPFDGTCDYARVMSRLDEYRYSGSLMLEIFNGSSPDYLKMSHPDFLATAYARLEKLAGL